MLSPQLMLAVCGFLLTAAALPATESPLPRPITSISADDFDDGWGFPSWFSPISLERLFAPLWKFMPSFSNFGPKIVSDKSNFRIIINAKDFKKDDLKVKIKNNFIFVQGSHEAKADSHDLFASQFFHTYSLPVNASAEAVTAELTSDGYLVLNAPLTGGDSEKKTEDREVPIKETGAPLPKDETTTTFPAIDDSERKEPTTPSTDREEVTEKETNSIPHGSETLP